MARWSVFVDAGVPVTVILLTLGELGIGPQRNETPNEMKITRSKEFSNAMKYLRANGIAHDFGDLQLSFVPLKPVISEVVTDIRRKNCGVIFSFFDPLEYVDHPDHDKTGEIARFAAASSDVTYFHQEIEALPSRPNLFVRTRDVSRATHMIPLSHSTIHHRTAYFEGFYPSQFPPDTVDKSEVIFDRLTSQENIPGKAELYWNIR